MVFTSFTPVSSRGCTASQPQLASLHRGCADDRRIAATTCRWQESFYQLLGKKMQEGSFGSACADRERSTTSAARLDPLEGDARNLIQIIPFYARRPHRFGDSRTA